MQVYRIDSYRFDSYEVRADGTLRIPAVFTKVGIFEYEDVANPGAVVGEFRPPEEVGNPDSLKSAELVTFTNDHPAELLNVDTIKDHLVGFTGSDVSFDGQYVTGEVVVNDRATIEAIKAGKRQISMGYTADVVKEPGEYNGKSYEFVQRNIRYNHGSLVMFGRAGPEVELRTDCAIHRKDNTMENMELELFGTTFSVPRDVGVAIMALMEKTGMGGESTPPKEEAPPMDNLEEMEEDPSSMDEEKPENAKMDSLQARLDAKDTEIANLKKQLKDTKRIDSAVKLRVDAARIMDMAKADSVDFAGKSDREVRELAIKAVSPDVKLDGKSDSYVTARFDIALETLQTSGTEILGEAVDSAHRNDAKKSDATAERIKRMRERGSKPLN